MQMGERLYLVLSTPVLGWTSSSIGHLLLLLLHEAGVSQTHPRNNGTQSSQLYVRWREGIMALGGHHRPRPHSLEARLG